MKRSTIIAAIAVIALLAVFVGIWVVSSGPAEIRNPVYIQWEYNGDENIDYSCITATGTERQEENAFVITNWEDYCFYQELAVQKSQQYENTHGRKSYSTEKKTMNAKPDEDFFDQYNLAVVDFCDPDILYLESHIKTLTIHENTASVEIYWEADVASTADIPGNVYWIQVPKDCTEVSATYDINLIPNPFYSD